MMEQRECKHIAKEKSTITLTYENYQTIKHDECGRRFLRPLIGVFLQQTRIKGDIDSNTIQTSHDGGGKTMSDDKELSVKEQENKDSATHRPDQCIEDENISAVTEVVASLP
jgi:hypothetical protein